MTELSKGANTALTSNAVTATLTWTPTPESPDVDASALLLREDGKVAGDDDFVFYNQPQHPSGAARHLGKTPGRDTVQIDLATLPDDVCRVVLAASADGGTFGQVSELTLVVADASSGDPQATFAMSADAETAFVSGELYRRGDGWKLRAVAQGYSSGLAGLATDFGISVGDEPEPEAAPEPPASQAPAAQEPVQPPAPPVQPPAPAAQPPQQQPAQPPQQQPAPASGAVNLDKGRVNLKKAQTVNLTKTGAPPLAKVVMGLGWDPNPGRGNIDLDASVIAFDQAGKKLEIVWFMHKKEFGKAIVHSGDNLTGKGEGDDEQIRVDLMGLPQQVHSLVFTINSFSGQKFDQVRRAFCRLVDEASGAELVRFNLSESPAHTGVLMAILRRTDPQTWQMTALGEFHDGRTVKKLVKPAAAHALAP